MQGVMAVYVLKSEEKGEKEKKAIDWIYEEGRREEATTYLKSKPEGKGGEIKQKDSLPEKGDKVIGSSIARGRMMVLQSAFRSSHRGWTIQVHQQRNQRATWPPRRICNSWAKIWKLGRLRQHIRQTSTHTKTRNPFNSHRRRRLALFHNLQ